MIFSKIKSKKKLPIFVKDRHCSLHDDKLQDIKNIRIELYHKNLMTFKRYLPYHIYSKIKKSY